jgi:hypothetical protein
MICAPTGYEMSTCRIQFWIVLHNPARLVLAVRENVQYLFSAESCFFWSVENKMQILLLPMVQQLRNNEISKKVLL